LKSRALIYHSLFWLGIYLLWVMVFRTYSFAITKTMTIEFCYLLFITVDYYAINYFIVPKFLLRKKYIVFFFASVSIISFSAWLRALVAVQMNQYFFHPASLTHFSKLYLNSVVNISLWVVLITVGKMMIERIQTEQKLEWLEKERVKNELDYLKAQINPHALFNSLNTIYGHIEKTNQIARNTLLQFSELLRYQLYDCGVEKVSLEKEIEYIKNYVAFQRLRKEEKLLVIVQIEVIESGLKIAPLLLTVLIENAFKYVSNFPDKENKIIINICTKDNILRSSFINTKELHQGNAFGNSNGIGIANLRRRLELLYRQKFELTTNIESELYETTLNINLA